jgi:predicted DCC family thiol-disulfide oxidoreductase YuxK
LKVQEIAMVLTSPAAGKNGRLYYDGECGFCLRWIRRQKRFIQAQGFELITIQQSDLAKRFELTEGDLLGEMKVVTKDERLIGGADAWLYVLFPRWRTRFLYYFGHTPGIHALLVCGYRWLARNRFRFGGRCELPTKGERP